MRTFVKSKEKSIDNRIETAKQEIPKQKSWHIRGKTKNKRPRGVKTDVETWPDDTNLSFDDKN